MSSSEAQANQFAGDSAVGSDGLVVVFTSAATNLVPGIVDGNSHIYWRHTALGVTGIADASSSEQTGNSYSGGSVAVGGAGRYTAFTSWSSNLVGGDSNGVPDVFVRDRLLGSTERVSVSTAGDEGDGDSSTGKISEDGRFVVFSSSATNLATGDTNAYQDVFIRDRQLGITARVSVASSGAEANYVSGAADLSDDGRYVAFVSAASRTRRRHHYVRAGSFLPRRIFARSASGYHGSRRRERLSGSASVRRSFTFPQQRWPLPLFHRDRAHNHWAACRSGFETRVPQGPPDRHHATGNRHAGRDRIGQRGPRELRSER